MNRQILRHEIYIIIFSAVIFFSNKNVYSQNEINQTDGNILITDNNGYILSGDKTDWSFSYKKYNDLISDEYLYKRPRLMSDVLIPFLESIYFEIIDNELILTWNTSKEINCKGFVIERAEVVSDETDKNWKKIGYEKGHNNSDELNKYSFVDEKLKKGRFQYRLKQESYDGSFEYFNLSEEVIWMDFPDKFQFYPVYPNPVTDSFKVRFFLPEKDEIRLFFLNGNDTLYLLNNELQNQGFYKMEIDKNSLGFNNEVKRLYIVRNKFKKKVYYGDIRFN
ncbi:MAG TPA: hypothetical protein PLD63_02555 [Ignavibacteria bacterium]|mgnify:CR=1 FL=1|nr:hypothetical protein [Ignavibacteria bacterium]